MSDRRSRQTGARVVRSSAWMLLNSAVTRAIMFVSQLLLAFILGRSDFGVYAAAMSISAFLTNLRGAGMNQWLTQGGEERFEERAGHSFWISLVFNLGLGLVLVGLAGPASDFFGDDQVRLVLAISGASFPLITFGSYYKSTLSIALRMREITIIEISSAFLRYGLIIVLAASGLGPLSFVIPLPLSFALEGFLGYFYTRDPAWRRRSHPAHWFSMIIRNRWIMVGTLVTTIALQADYFTLGRLTTLTTLGVYYFAYQITYMTASLVTENLRRVLFPGLVAVPAARRPSAALRAAVVGTVLGAPLLTVLGAVIDPLEHLVWQGKWDDAVVPIQLFCLGLPLQLMTTVTQSSLQSDGRFRLWSAVNAMRAACVAAGALLAGSIFPQDITMIAAIMTVTLAVANASQVGIVYKVQGITLTEVARRCLASALIAPVAMYVTVIVAGTMQLSSSLAIVVNLGVFLIAWLCLTLAFDRKALGLGLDALRSAVGKSR